MKISNSFNKFFWGAIIQDIKENCEYVDFMGHRFPLKKFSKKSIHNFLKIVAKFPVNYKMEPKSLSEIDSKELTEYLERVRWVLGQSGFTLKIDNEQWEQTIKNAIERGY
jgi:hypothetical protein